MDLCQQDGAGRVKTERQAVSGYGIAPDRLFALPAPISAREPLRASLALCRSTRHFRAQTTQCEHSTITAYLVKMRVVKCAGYRRLVSVLAGLDCPLVLPHTQLVPGDDERAPAVVP